VPQAEADDIMEDQRRLGEGRPEPLGVTARDGGINVAVVSQNATRIEVCLFGTDGETETARIALPERTGDVFHGFIPDVAPGTRYGLRVDGPFDADHGHRFNPAKLLVDPYATALDRPFRLDPLMFDRTIDGRIERDDADSASVMPKAIVPAGHSPNATSASIGIAQPESLLPPQVGEGGRRPDEGPRDSAGAAPRSASDVVYELHVRGFTKTHPDIPEAIRGTMAGLAHPAAIDHLVKLGVGTVELMPLSAWIDERHLVRLGLTNYWGYNPVALLAPDPRLAPGGMAEVRAAVDALHAAGLSVILDVVLNHTGEGDAFGPTVSLRGLDSALYFRHGGDRPGGLIDDTGCGNTLALDRPAMLRLAMDTLRHWAIEAGVDGFRFDLGATLGRRADGFDPAAPLYQAIEQDPLLRGLRIVAEPWDIGPGGYRLGELPERWGEWNDKYRDTVRRFWRGDQWTVGELATRLAGSADVFAARHRRPSSSVDFLAAHDGFSLADLVSYEHKHNAANGEDNRDGHGENFSWNHGVEGPTDDAAIRAARAGDVRALLTTLLVSRGAPMIAMGDELGRTQGGNNNAYCQDGPLSWIDWPSADLDLAAFVGRLVRLRAQNPALSADRFLTGAPIDDSGIVDVEWRTPAGSPMAPADWESGENHTLIAAYYAAAADGAVADRAVVVLHAGPDPLDVVLPDAEEGRIWCVAADSAAPDEASSARRYDGLATVPVSGRSAVVLLEGVKQSETNDLRPEAAVPSAPTETASQTAPAARDESRSQITDHDPAAVGPAPGEEVPPSPTVAGPISDAADPERGADAEAPPAPPSPPEPPRAPAVVPARIETGVLDRLAAAAGLAPHWFDVGGTRHVVGVEAKQAILAAMRLPAETTADARQSLARLAERRDRRRLPPVIVARDGAPATVTIAAPAPRALVLERADGVTQPLLIGLDAPRITALAADGRGVERVRVPLPPLPVGVHRLVTEDGAVSCRVIVAPRRCHLPPALAGDHKAVGLATHLYAVRRDGDAGIGDFTALSALGRLAAGAGAVTVGINPLHALSAVRSDQASPYHGSDRHFLDWLYVDIGRVPDATALPAAPPARLIDYPAVRAAKRAALETAYQTFRRRAVDDPLVRERAAFVAAGGEALRRFAVFEAIAESRPDERWSAWPEPLRHHASPAVAAFAAANADRVGFALHLQWLADRQLAAATADMRAAGLSCGLYRDLAVGASPSGSEAWAGIDDLVTGVSVGAPPDPFTEEGQVWGLPAPDPLRMAETGYVGFQALLAANMRHAGLIRIDHAMALTRLFLVPEGMKAMQGTYVAYPVDDLLGVLALESERAQCAVVGEDLGTVPEGFREKLLANGVLSYRVVPFEQDETGFRPPSSYPVNSVASASSHDLPPIPGFWTGSDLEIDVDIGRISEADLPAAREKRALERAALAKALEAAGVNGITAETTDTTAVVDAVHAFLAETPSRLVTLQVDDLTGETEPLNKPGTDSERPNWRRRLSMSVEEIAASEIPARIAAVVAERGRETGGEGGPS
jgi:glycogen debranching enzyme GlgX/4-alpha-glucanotransferase